MKTTKKKMGGLLVACALVLGCMTTPALAATIGPSDGGKATTTDIRLNIVKTLKVTNPELIQVSGPGLQLAYTVAPATVAAGTTVSDGTHSALVHPGPTGGLHLDTNGAPSFSVSDLLDASSAGADNTKNIALVVDMTKFTEPGIYRYELTDTTSNAALQAAGVTRSSDFTNVRYVDVYVQQDPNEDRLIIEGYVVGSDNDGNGNLAKETFDTSTTTENQQDPDIEYKVFDTRDVFNTYNAVLTKSVTGSMGDIHHQFPFGISLTTGGRSYYADKGVAPSSSTPLNRLGNITGLQTTLANNEHYYIGGLTVNDTVAYTETNNTTNTYAVSITGGRAAGATNVAPNGTKVMAATDVVTAANVTFENNLGSVSPTGVIMQFGPYVGMVLIAIALLVLRRKSKARN